MNTRFLNTYETVLFILTAVGYANSIHSFSKTSFISKFIDDFKDNLSSKERDHFIKYVIFKFKEKSQKSEK